MIRAMREGIAVDDEQWAGHGGVPAGGILIDSLSLSLRAQRRNLVR
jgi:hypothetical protein